MRRIFYPAHLTPLRALGRYRFPAAVVPIFAAQGNQQFCLLLASCTLRRCHAGKGYPWTVAHFPRSNLSGRSWIAFQNFNYQEQYARVFANSKLSVFSWVSLFIDDCCHAEEFRADLEAGAFRRKKVYFKMKRVSFHGQVDDPSQRSESFAFANGQRA